MAFRYFPISEREGLPLAREIYGTLALPCEFTADPGWNPTSDTRFRAFFFDVPPCVSYSRPIQIRGDGVAPVGDPDSVHGYQPRRVSVLEGRNIEVVGRGHSPTFLFGSNHIFRNANAGKRLTPSRTLDEVVEVSHSDRPIYSLKRQSDPIRENSPALLLRSWGNWDHFIRQTLTAIQAMRDLGFKAGNLKYFATTISDSQVCLLEELGIDREQIRILDGRRIISAKIYCVSTNETGHVHSPGDILERTSSWISDVVPRKFGPRRIYVSRANASRRKVLNEADVIRALANYGFQSIDPGSLSLADQTSFFSMAEHVIGPHGMGLTNAIFSQQLKSITEIMSRDWVRPSYFRTAQLKDARYAVVYEAPNSDGDITIDISNLLDVVREFSA